MNESAGVWCRLLQTGVLLLVLASAGAGAQASSAAAVQLNESKAFGLLGEAVPYLDELVALPKQQWFGRDQASAVRDIDNIIQQAIEVLALPEVDAMRQNYRKLEARIAAQRMALSRLRERRVLAEQGDATAFTRFTPSDTLREYTAKTRGDFDLLIEAREANLMAYQRELANLRGQLSQALGALGIYLPEEQLELWLSSVIGDDILSMKVVFESIRTMAGRLQELNRENGENLEYARRYYGMLVVLHKLVVVMQQQFIRKVDNQVLPQLQRYREEAQQLIAESNQLIRAGGNRASLMSNVGANRLTVQVIDLYARLVRRQRDEVAQLLQHSQRAERVASNTYHTVRLSARVIDLLQQGARNFENLTDLQIPDMSEFQNAAVREEFKRLTLRLEGA